MIAAHHYSLALRALNDTLSNPDVAKSDSALGACLLLCIYEVSSCWFILRNFFLDTADSNLPDHSL